MPSGDYTHNLPRYDLAIAGGGMVGASLALLCQQACPEWRIALIDAAPAPAARQSEHPSFDARSTVLSAGSAALLSGCGLWPKLAAQATAIERVHVSDRGYLPGQLLTSTATDDPALGYVLSNAWLGRVLLAQVAECANIEQITARARRCQPDAQGAVLQLEGACDCRAKLVVVADGANSALRASLGIGVREKVYDQSAIIANVRFSRPHNGVAYERFTSTGPVALLPLGQSANAREAALVWTQPQSRAQALAAAPDDEFLAQLQRQFGFRLGRFSALGRRDCYGLSLRQAREQVRRSVVLMGNAAHSLHPVAGQGFNLALRDCAALVEEFSQAGSSGESPGSLALLQRYVARQRQDQWLTTQVGDKLVQLFGKQPLPITALRHLGLLSLECLPALKGRFRRQMMGRAGSVNAGTVGVSNDG